MKKTRILSAVLLATIVAGTFASLTAQAPVGARKDPLPAFHFVVEIDGIASASFAEVSGLSCETTVIEYRDGSDPNRIRLLPGETRCGPVVLRRGLTTNTELWDWFESVADGDVDRKSISVVILERDRTEAARFNLHECFPTTWTLGPMDAKGSNVLIEELTIACERMEWAR